MSARFFRGVSLLVVPGISGVLLAAATSPGAPARAAANSSSLLRRVKATFIQNRGQVSGGAEYYVAGRDRTVYFTPAGLTYSLRPARTEPFGGGLPPTPNTQHPTPARSAMARYALKLDFAGASPTTRITGESRQPGTVNYLMGRREQQRTAVPTFGGLRYGGLWRGIDLAYQGTAAGLKYEYQLQPGADPRDIRLSYQGAESVRIGEHGELVVSTPAGVVRDAPPVSYQEIDGRRVEVASSYELRGTSKGRCEYGFHLGAYDPSRPLVIDPVVLVYAGYIGGVQGEVGAGVAVDGQGAAYVAGYTFSTEDTFPDHAGFDATYGGSGDAFVAKLLPDGSGFSYCSYLGGTDQEIATCIAVDGAGRAYVGGATDSTAASFPVTGGPALTAAGDTEGFVARVAADGASLEYCGYVGGNASDMVQGIAVDGNNRAYVVGVTESAEGTFPVVGGPDLTANGGADAFVARVSASGSFEYCGYLGGTNEDAAFGVAVRPDGTAFVTGDTRSDQATFPVTVGPDLTYNDAGPDQDAFVAEVASNGSSLLYCGYLGGDAYDSGRAIAVDGSGAAYVTGGTGSGPATFPEAVGPSLALAGGRDAYVARIAPGGATLSYCGYLGGVLDEEAFGLALDGDLNVYVGGVTRSDQRTFPVVSGPDLTYQGGFQDGWIARVHTGAIALDYCGYVGGAGTDFVSGLALDGSGRAYVAGATSSGPDSFPARVGPVLRFNAGSPVNLADAFVATVSAFTAPDPNPGKLVVSPKKLNGGTVKVGKSKSVKLKLKNAGQGPVTVNLASLVAPFSLTPTGNLTVAAHRTQTVTVTFTPTVIGQVVSGIAITSNDPKAPLTVIPLAGKGK